MEQPTPDGKAAPGKPSGQGANPPQGYVFLDNAPQLVRLLEDIFTDEFMRAHTRFQSFDDFRYSSAVVVNWGADTLVYAPHLLDALVRESTRFDGWDAMVRAATDLRYRG